MTQVDHYDLLNWSGCWPMGFRGRRKWNLRFITMTEVKSLRSIWRHKGKRKTMRTTHRLVMKEDLLGRSHSVLSRARNSSIETRPFALVVRGVVIDGNHLLLALIERNYRGKVLIAETRSRSHGKHLWLPKDL